jgi:uncharacterized protein with HEPN domain
VAMSLFQIGELANHLSKELTKDYSDVAWVKIVGLRNVIAHGYGTLTYPKVWDISDNYIQELKKRCTEIISEIDNESQ